MHTRPAPGASWDKAVVGTCIAVILMGLTVIASWHLHIRAAVPILQGMVPMQYNPALCLVALGVAGIGLSTRRPALLVAGAAFAALMGGAVTLEYLTGVSFGIDTLFFYPWELMLPGDAGRMALTTAISCFLSGTALLVLAVRGDAYGVFGIINSLPLSLALTSLIGYAFQITYVLPFRLGTHGAAHGDGVLRLWHRDGRLLLEICGSRSRWVADLGVRDRHCADARAAGRCAGALLRPGPEWRSKHQMSSMISSSIMRTTMDIDDPILREVKAIHEQEGRSMGAVVSELLADALARRRAPRARPAFRWTSRPMKALVDLADKDTVYAALDAERS